jgi:Amt family ammonium transporter
MGWLGYTSIDADGIATSVMTARTMAAAMGGLVWVVLDVILRRPLPLWGFCLGIISGLVAISAADGFVTNTGAAIIAFFASGAAYVCANYLTTVPGFEIAQRVFAIHGIGGAVGVVLTGPLSSPAVNGNLARLVPMSGGSAMNGGVIGHPLVLFQVGAVLVTMLISTLGTFVIAFTLKAVLKRQRTKAGPTVPV